MTWADEAEKVQRWGRAWHTDDVHPCYLPDGGIAFASTRCEYGILCDGRDKLTTSVIYRMDADGRAMQKLSNNSVSESATLPTGTWSDSNVPSRCSSASRFGSPGRDGSLSTLQPFS